MRHRTVFATLAAAAIAGLVSTAKAQVREIPAFFGGGGNQAAFDPEIDIVESGAKLDVQATVSADRKYVTMTARPQLANLVALREFTFQNGAPRGIVGLPTPPNPAPANPAPQNQDQAPDAGANRRGARARADKAPPATAPAAPHAAAPTPPAAPSVLEREGMFRIVLQAAR